MYFGSLGIVNVAHDVFSEWLISIYQYITPLTQKTE